MPIQVKSSHLKVTYTSALVCIFLVVIHAFAGGYRVSTRVASTAPQIPPVAFTLTSSRTVTGPDGLERLLSSQQRFQRSDGIYKLVQTFYTPDRTAARTQTYFGFIGLGVFRLDDAHKRLVFTGPLIDDRPADVEKFLRAHELFTREESVAGVNSVVWRQEGPEKGEFLEEYRAPSLGGLLVRTVKVSALGRETVEPTAIQMGEPASNLFDELLAYPVDYSRYEQQVHETEKKNESDIALLMRQSLERMRQARP